MTKTCETKRSAAKYAMQNAKAEGEKMKNFLHTFNAYREKKEKLTKNERTNDDDEDDDCDEIITGCEPTESNVTRRSAERCMSCSTYHPPTLCVLLVSQ